MSSSSSINKSTRHLTAPWCLTSKGEVRFAFQFLYHLLYFPVICLSSFLHSPDKRKSRLHVCMNPYTPPPSSPLYTVPTFLFSPVTHACHPNSIKGRKWLYTCLLVTPHSPFYLWWPICKMCFVYFVHTYPRIPIRILHLSYRHAVVA